MPLRHSNGKWYWGSKGPFDTKAKALAVARAAYAHGYKSEQSDKKVAPLILESKILQKN